jgi:hypothetical protein
MAKPQQTDDERRDAILKRMLETPPKPHKKGEGSKKGGGRRPTAKKG